MTLTSNDSRSGAAFDSLDLAGHDLGENREPLGARIRSRIAGISNQAKTALAGSPTARSRSKTQVECSMRAVDGPLYYGDDGHWHACIRLATIPLYSRLNEDQKIAQQKRLANLIGGLQGYKGVLRSWGEDLSVEQLLEAWRSEAILSPDDTEGWEAFLAKIESEAGRMHDKQYKVRVFAIDVRLPDRQLGGRARNENDYQEYERGRQEFGINHPGNHRLVKLYAELMEAAQAAYDSARPVSQDMLVGVYLRNTWRGAPERPTAVFSNSKPISSPNKLAWLGEGNELDLVNMLRMDYMGAIGYVSYLSLAVMPENGPACPGLEYLWLSDSRGDPLDVVVHFTVVTPEEIRLKMEAHDAKVTEFRQDLRKRNGQAGQNDIDEILDDVAEYLDYAKAGKPGVRYTVTIGATGLTPDDVRYECRRVIRMGLNTTVEGDEVVWVVPNGLQSDLHAMCRPGSRIEFDRYIQEAEPLALAAGMPNATDVPSVRGRWMGELTGRDRGPFLWSMESVLNKDVDTGTVTVVVGPPGQGKSTLIMDLGIAQAQSGSFAIIREGSKGDTTLFQPDQVEHLPRYDVLDISEEPGCFNPGLWGENLGQRVDNLAAFLAANSPNWRPNDWGDLYTYCKGEILSHPNEPDFRRVIRELAKEEGAARRISRDLAPLEDLAEADICRGNREQSNRLILGLRPGLTVWRNQRWLLPAGNKAENNWSTLERFSASALQLQFAFSRQVALVRKRRTFTADDEFHERAGLAVGVRDFNLHGRWGRSMGSLYLIATHGGGPEDIPKVFLDYATQAVAFRPPTDEAAVAYARLLGADPRDEAFIADLKNLGCDETGQPIPELKGEAMIKLPNRQIVRAQFTRNFVGKTAFVTTSDTHQRAQLAAV